MKATRTCSIEGCDRPHYGRGWCKGHYMRWYAKGDPGTAGIGPDRPGPGTVEYASLTWKKLMRRRTVTAAGCWEWTGCRDRHGYGRIAWGDDTRFTHRIALELAQGSIPDGLVVDHLCRNPPCFNPAHLQAVQQRTNLLRGETVPASRSAITHCPQGHEYDSANTYLSKRGQRHCRTCLNTRSRARYWAKKAISQ